MVRRRAPTQVGRSTRASSPTASAPGRAPAATPMAAHTRGGGTPTYGRGTAAAVERATPSWLGLARALRLCRGGAAEPVAIAARSPRKATPLPMRPRHRPTPRLAGAACTSYRVARCSAATSRPESSRAAASSSTWTAARTTVRSTGGARTVGISTLVARLALVLRLLLLLLLLLPVPLFRILTLPLCA